MWWEQQYPVMRRALFPAVFLFKPIRAVQPWEKSDKPKLKDILQSSQLAHFPKNEYPGPTTTDTNLTSLERAQCTGIFFKAPWWFRCAARIKIPRGMHFSQKERVNEPGGKRSPFGLDEALYLEEEYLTAWGVQIFFTAGNNQERGLALGCPEAANLTLPNQEGFQGSLWF